MYKCKCEKELIWCLNSWVCIGCGIYPWKCDCAKIAFDVGAFLEDDGDEVDELVTEENSK